MNILSIIGRGLGGQRVAAPLIWLDATDRGLADVERLETDLIVVPQWNERARVARLLLKAPVRLVIEYHHTDVSLARLALSSWGEVRWQGGQYHARPLALRHSASVSRASEQLAKVHRIRKCDAHY
jgi:hypothetical protein